jgi:hypothetical protein
MRRFVNNNISLQLNLQIKEMKTVKNRINKYN